MADEFLDLTADNLANEHLCCIIRTRRPHPGVEAKRVWLADRLNEGHVFRKLDERAAVFIEYAPLESAWVPVMGDNYLYLYCLWVLGSSYRGRGYGSRLMESCLADAEEQGRSGVCMLGARRQKAWLSDQRFARGHGFATVDETETGYELLAYSLDGTVPRFSPAAKVGTIASEDLTVYYDDQCPYIHQSIELVRARCAAARAPVALVHVETLEQSKALPCPFNNYAVFYRGRLETVNLLDSRSLDRLIGAS
ncbi:GNAT family N-acetyltransferase [Thermophilibacter immobilis]|uniref:GNAT family N-acetyltransferase n=1 Tax=Thermophilibacter immobilis TaxID=2779519 RepID=A0A7S7RU00_9ACTN|nr:GNAT family N-acetyltransferase [Thermophilibacter immobilis]QOY59912.1 GNAT family N-acetyltransferase [Thermophilibacter immobilis]